MRVAEGWGVYPVYIGIFLVSLATLAVELALMRAFDVILTPNLAYLVITLALFAFGLSGVYVAVRPAPSDKPVRPRLAALAALFALFILAVLPLMNMIPFNHEEIFIAPARQAAAFGGMYLVLVLPFFMSGLVFATLFSAHTARIQRLYAWDLSGAALGSVLVAPLILPFGPGGLLFFAAAIVFLASCLFATGRAWRVATLVAAAIAFTLPLVRRPAYYDFVEHVEKRGVKEARTEGRIELTRWDPVSKIDVVNLRPRPRVADGTGEADEGRVERKHVAYDGGAQSTHIYRFDGDLDALRAELERDPGCAADHFWGRRVPASHHLMRDTGYRVLVIGSAGGQETKAALAYGAGHIDGVEMVATVVALGARQYADYNGGIFLDPRVDVVAGEGRSFLRARRDRYDVIQIFSNHTSSSIAAGSGAMAPQYLLTVEAFREFFEHLSDEGILHINHHVYPRVVTTAAAAWRRLGREEFARHVAVFQQGDDDRLPTVLVKMSAWTETELADISAFLVPDTEREAGYRLVENPLGRGESFLTPEFYSGNLPAGLVRRMDYRIAPPTDDKPYFNFLRKRYGILGASPEAHLDSATAEVLNSQLRKGLVPMDVIHLVVTAAVTLLFSVVFVFVPLWGSEVGRARWPGKAVSLAYFGCLGAGFITIELVFIQLFMKLIGFPLTTYSTVIFTMLLGAGLGSYASAWMRVARGRRWMLPFAGIPAAGLGALVLEPVLAGFLMSNPMSVRVAAAAALIFPLGFFLGMPFPMGILLLEARPRGAIAWAWGLNGFCTVAGGLAGVVSSLFLGFRVTVLIALAVYGLAAACYAVMRRGLVVAMASRGAVSG